MLDRAATWDLGELTAKVARALSERGYVGTESGRVRDIPDARVIRYYTTLGLLDRPAELRGRTAFYSARHLAQLVAIKKLQARGHSLAKVQRVLAGIGDEELLRIANAAQDAVALHDAAAQVPTTPATVGPPRSAAFWKQQPAAAAPRVQIRSAAAIAPEPLLALKLGEGVTLLLSATRGLVASEIERIAEASGALLSVLETLGLAGGASGAPEGTAGEP